MPILRYLTTTYFDHDALAKLPEAMSGTGIVRPLIAADQGIVAAGLADRVKDALPEGTRAVIYDKTPANPTEAAVTEATALFKSEGCDGVIALGGGSPMDLGKAVALMAHADEPLVNYAGVDRGKIKQIAPVIAIPTTAGTGSEVSVGFIIIVEDGRKLTFISPKLIPAAAICDPMLTLGLPPHLTAATGMDAVTHAFEAVLSPAKNPPAEAIGLDGLDRTLRMGWLEQAVSDGSNKDARWQMMMAATEGALAFIKGLGSVHAMSHSAGRLKDLNLHHGTLNAVILPTVLRFNADNAKDKYDRIRKMLELAPGADLADLIEDLNTRIGMPRNLGQMGLSLDRMDELVPEALTDLATYTNPRKATAEDYTRLFEEAITKN